MNGTALITGLYGGYDTLKDPVDLDGVDDYVCVTDDPELTSDVWRIEFAPRPDLHPNLAAKHPKFMPWRYTACNRSLWIDASIRPTSPTFITEALELKGDALIAQFRHPDRDCIYQEADASIGLAKYSGQPITEQMARYHLEHPPHWGLWETGVLVLEHFFPVVALGLDWMHECEHWTFQDQLSEPVLLRRRDMRPVELPGGIRDSSWFEYTPSERHAA